MQLGPEKILEIINNNQIITHFNSTSVSSMDEFFTIIVNERSRGKLMKLYIKLIVGMAAFQILTLS